MRSLTSVPVLMIGIALLAGCTTGPTPTPTPSITAEPRPAPPADTAAELTGTWTITDVADGMSGSIILGNGGWEATYECGPIQGTWIAAGDRFLATWSGGSMGCFDNIDPQPLLAWVASTTRLAQTDSGWTLLDATGTTTATLTNGIAASPAPTPTVVTPLASTYTVAPLDGRWIPLVDDPGKSYLELDENEWTASDGCNGARGRWLDLGDGYLVTTPPGISTQIGCENIPVAEWVGQARTAGFDGDELVLFDAAGDELGRFVAD